LFDSFGDLSLDLGKHIKELLTSFWFSESGVSICHNFSHYSRLTVDLWVSHRQIQKDRLTKAQSICLYPTFKASATLASATSPALTSNNLRFLNLPRGRLPSSKSNLRDREPVVAINQLSYDWSARVLQSDCSS